MAKLAADLEGSTMMREPEPMVMVSMADGGYLDDLASMGRKGDTMLAHINPQEAQMLMEEGGSGTINPMTGLPEFFFADWSGFDDSSIDGGDDDLSSEDYTESELDEAEFDTPADFFDDPTPQSTLDIADVAFTDQFQDVLNVADNRQDIDATDIDFLGRLSNSIKGNTQDSKGNNIGLTGDEIQSLGYYTDNPDDPRFGKYLGYNELVGINAFKSINENLDRLDQQYMEQKNQEFKDKGLDARVTLAKDSVGGFSYIGKDATRAALGEIGGGIAGLFGTLGKAFYNIGSMSPTRIAFDALTGGRLMSMEKGKEGPPSLGGYLGQQIFDSPPLESLGKTLSSVLGVGTDKEADEVTVDSKGQVVSASTKGEDINLSGVPTAEETMENILNQDAMMTPDAPNVGMFLDTLGTSPQTGLPTDEQFLDMTSGDVPAYSVSDFEDPTIGFTQADAETAARGVDLDELNTAPDYQALADERRDDYLSTLDLNTASTLVDPATATAFVDQSDRFDDGMGVDEIPRKRKPVTVSQAIDEVVEEDKPYFPKAQLPRLTESGLKSLQYIYRNDPEILENIYNRYALPEQYSGLKALV